MILKKSQLRILLLALSLTVCTARGDKDVEFLDDEELETLLKDLDIDSKDEAAIQQVLADTDELIDFTDLTPDEAAQKAPSDPKIQVPEEYTALIKRSPFLPPDYVSYEEELPVEGEISPQGDPTPPISQDLDLTGMMLSNSEFLASLRNKSGESFWVRKDDPQAVYKIKDYDLDKKTIILDDGFSKKTLKLIEPEPTSAQIPWPQLSRKDRRRPPTPEELEEERETAELLRKLLED